jgi:hypothetical protein
MKGHAGRAASTRQVHAGKVRVRQKHVRRMHDCSGAGHAGVLDAMVQYNSAPGAAVIPTPSLRAQR